MFAILVYYFKNYQLDVSYTDNIVIGLKCSDAKMNYNDTNKVTVLYSPSLLICCLICYE
jgi:hypothetical protein